VIKQYKKRKLLYIGCILFVSAFIILNQFIWKIEITGCQTVSESAVREKLEECGLKVGVFRPFLDEQKLKNNMLIKMPELAWLWADKTGSKVTVEIKEKKPKPEMYDQDAFCNIVAKKDGVIDSMIVTYGSPLVKIGDSVRAGDILVSGLLISEKNAAPRMVQSHADIYARVWYEKTRAYSLLRPVYSETGAMEKKYTLHLFGYDLALYRDKNSPFELFETQTEKKECTLFGIYMGLGITRKTYIEQTVTYEQISAESMAETSAAELLSEIDAEASADSELQNSRTTYEVIDEETISVTATAEYLENIAIKKEIMPQT